MDINSRMTESETFGLRWLLAGYRSNRDQLRAAYHEVRDGKPLAAQLPSRDQLVGLLRELLGAGAARELWPRHVLFADTGRVVWHRPAERRPVFFHTGKQDFDAAFKGRSAVFPPLLFLALPGQLYVWALDSDVRPEAASPVFRAPFLNLYESGHMCAGTAKLPLEVSTDVTYFERAFFETTFTHSNYRDRLSLHSGGHDGLWRALAHPERQTFPVETLLPLRGKGGNKPLTVGEILNLEVRA